MINNNQRNVNKRQLSMQFERQLVFILNTEHMYKVMQIHISE